MSGAPYQQSEAFLHHLNPRITGAFVQLSVSVHFEYNREAIRDKVDRNHRIMQGFYVTQLFAQEAFVFVIWSAGALQTMRYIAFLDGFERVNSRVRRNVA